MHRVSPQLFYKQPVSLSHLFTPSFKFGKIHIPDSSIVATNFPVAVSINPPKYASFSRAWELDAASDSEFLLILLSGFLVAMSISGLFGCNRTFRGWGTCRNMRRQDHRCRFRFCHTSFFSFLVLHPFRHRFGAAYQTEILSAASGAEMADIEQWRRLFHSSRVKFPLLNMSASWFLVSM